MAKAPLEIKSLARAHTATALEVLAGVMCSKTAPHAARISAAQYLLDRGWGRAAQHIETDANYRLTIERIDRQIIEPGRLLRTDELPKLIDVVTQPLPDDSAAHDNDSIINGIDSTS